MVTNTTMTPYSTYHLNNFWNLNRMRGLTTTNSRSVGLINFKVLFNKDNSNIIMSDQAATRIKCKFYNWKYLTEQDEKNPI